MNEEKKWIQKAIKHPGALHKALGVPQGEKIPAEKLNAAAQKGGKVGKQARLAKTLKSLHEFVQLQEEKVFKVTDHLGKTHDVSAKDASDAKKKVVSVGGTIHPQGIPMSQWTKVKVHEETEQLDERKLTAAETSKKEEIVKSMKKNKPGFEERYGERAKEVMYATATKKAKELAEDLNWKSHPKLAGKKLLHTPDGKPAVYSQDYVAKAVAKKYGGSPQFSNTAGKFHIIKEDQVSPEQLRYTMSKSEHPKEYEKSKQDQKKKDYKKATGLSEEHKIHATGTKVSFPHNGQMKTGKVVRYDSGDKHGTAFYVVDHGAYESAKVPVHKVQLAETNWEARRQRWSEWKAKNPGYVQKKHEEKVAQKREESKKKVDSAVGPRKYDEAITYNVVKDIIEETFTRKHFRQVADVISKHPDAAKRKELASHHSEIFAKSNPRFDKKRFYAAANAELGE